MWWVGYLNALCQSRHWHIDILTLHIARFALIYLQCSLDSVKHRNYHEHPIFPFFDIFFSDWLLSRNHHCCSVFLLFYIFSIHAHFLVHYNDSLHNLWRKDIHHWTSCFLLQYIFLLDLRLPRSRSHRITLVSS